MAAHFLSNQRYHTVKHTAPGSGLNTARACHMLHESGMSTDEQVRMELDWSTWECMDPERLCMWWD